MNPQQLIAALLLATSLMLFRSMSNESISEFKMQTVRSGLFSMSGCGPGCRI